MTRFTERRKSDRAKMADAVAEIAREYGATATIEPEGSNDICPRRVMIRIEAQRGLCLNLDFDGKSCQPDVYVLSWHFNHDTDACFSDRFASFGSLNRFHFRKATHVAYGYTALIATLERCLDLAQGGEAFDPDREAAAIRIDGTAKERNARWNAYFSSLKAAA